MSKKNKGQTPAKKKKRVVFMPYKASLWDCLASIYDEAVRDASADVCVVPVPWYERDDEGNLAVMHDETDDFPKGLKIINWKKYNIKRKNPDIVFVHNPYDEFNAVAVIHPDFFIREIRPYVRELVYVPYFVAINGWVPADRLMSAGMDFADLIPVESESVRRQYINVYKKYGIDNNIWDKMEPHQGKFKVLGSPKFDSIRKTQDQEVLPDGWDKILKKPNGEKKKVVLYITSVQAMYDSTIEMMEKIEDNFRKFREKKDDIALIFRPHPLYREAVIKHDEEEAKRYDEIISEYRKAGWGIYDDTPDLARSIRLSDAYYGDWSSVVTLYELTGKPILIQGRKVH